MSKIRGSISGAIPTPVSRTEITASRPSAAGRQLDPPPSLGVLGRVGQQIDEHLLEPRGVGVERQRLGPAVDARAGARARSISGRTAAAARATTSRGVDRLAAELDLARADPRDVEQVVDQPRELADLAFERLARPGAFFLSCAAGAGGRARRPCRARPRGLRSSCASVARNSSLWRSASTRSFRRLAQLFLQPLPLGDVAHDPGEQPPVAEPELADGQVHREGRAVAAAAHHLAADADDLRLAGGAGNWRGSRRAPPWYGSGISMLTLRPRISAAA